jgi:hypothetical protein
MTVTPSCWCGAAGAGKWCRGGKPHAIGTVIVGGLSVATVLTLFFTPVLYLLLAGLTSPGNETEKALEAELAAHARGRDGTGLHPASAASGGPVMAEPGPG